MSLQLFKRAVCCQGRAVQVAVPQLPCQHRPQALVRRCPAVCRSAAVNQPTTEAVPAAETSPMQADTATATPVTVNSISDTNNSNRKVMRVGSDTQTIKAAKYVAEMLQTLPDGQALLMRALGAKSSARAARIIARASEILSVSDGSSVITFQPRRRPIRVQDIEDRTAPATEFFIRKAAAAAYASDALPEGQHPMYIRSATDAAKISSHIMYAAKTFKSEQRSQPIAQFTVDGLTSRMMITLAGIMQTRFELIDGQNQDVLIRISRAVQEAPAQSQQQQQQQEDDSDATVAAAASEAVEADDSESPSSADSSTATLYVYTLSVYLCDPWSSEARRSLQSRMAKQDAAKPQRGKKPGVVEVPEAEWAQLKEQLELVPHLTEQLQVMTQQHEQLLGLLVAQQQQQQQGQQGQEQQQQ